MNPNNIISMRSVQLWHKKQSLILAFMVSKTRILVKKTIILIKMISLIKVSFRLRISMDLSHWPI